ncbi:MAG: hypothetical protein ACYS91_06650 [Planctomycetota bacterium]|jgi:hypothetical protein
MNTFIEKNRRLLKFYCVAARIIGWALLFLSGILIVYALLEGNFPNVFRASIRPFRPLNSYAYLPANWMGSMDNAFTWATRFLLTGLLALGIAQFIKFLSDSKYQPGCLLRCGEGILYLYAVLLVAQVIWRYLFCPAYTSQLVSTAYTRQFGADPLLFLAVLLITGAKVLALVGLAQILWRVMRVVEESRTLV